MDSKGAQPHIYMSAFSPKLPAHPSCPITLSRVPRRESCRPVFSLVCSPTAAGCRLQRSQPAAPLLTSATPGGMPGAGRRSGACAAARGPQEVWGLGSSGPGADQAASWPAGRSGAQRRPRPHPAPECTSCHAFRGCSPLQGRGLRR